MSRAFVVASNAYSGCLVKTTLANNARKQDTLYCSLL